MSELKYNEPAERFAPIVEKSLYAGATAVMVPSETGCWVHYVEYCERIADTKSEADKVIADLEESHKKEVSQLLILNREQANSANRLRDSMEQVIRHHKYKRCLAMAKVCYLRFVRYENYLQKLCASNATIAAYVFRRDMYDKWEKRWIALAEEPTWAKFLQLIHKEAK